MATKRKSLAETYIISEDESNASKNIAAPSEEKLTDSQQQVLNEIPIENRINLSQDDIDEVKPVEQEIIPTEQIMTQTVTVIQNQTIQTVPQKEFTELEKSYLNRLDSVRHKIDNPAPINRINKRRKYTEEKRRNVTFSILEDLCIILDDLVDDAKIYKGKFQDEIMIRGMINYIKENGIN